MSFISRYNDLMLVSTHLNPLEDITSWIAGLNSTGYISDILRTTHGISRTNEIRNCAKSISMYARNSLGLTEQAFSGPPEVSFLPLYYAILNLSKIYIVLSGQRAALQVNRWHGAVYPTEKNSRDLLTERVILKQNGVLPLFYETLTGVRGWQEKKLSLDEIYPYIHDVSYEYKHAYKKPPALQSIDISIGGNSSDGYNLTALLVEDEHPNASDKKYLKILTGFQKDNSQKPTYVSQKVFQPTEDDARNLLTQSLKRYLLYDPMPDPLRGSMRTYNLTPISNKKLLLPEEIPIWIAFFHLSNVVRYKPEFLAQLQDSVCWPILLTLRKHAFLKFLLLFWSYLHQTVFMLEVK